MILLTTILLLVNVALASENKSTADYQFRQFTIKEGLSQSAVLSIIQDKKGFMWFGTANGLNRFDGYYFITYVHKPGDVSSISDNVITSIFEDKDGYLWVGTVKGILNKFDRKTEVFEYFYPDSSRIKAILTEPFTKYPISFIRNDNSSITSITEDKNGNLWIGTWGNGLYRFDKKTEKFEHFINDPQDVLSLSNNRVTKIIIDNKSVIWVGTFGGGLNRVAKIQDEKSETKYRYGFINYKSNESQFSISSNYVLSIFNDKSNNIWIGTYEGGLNKLTDSQKFSKVKETKFIRYFSGNDSNKFPYKTIFTIVDGDENNIWFGTLGGGLVQFNSITNSILNFKHNPMDANSISDNDVIILEKDRSGILWIGTSLGNGINQLQINRKKFNHIKHSPGDKNSLSDNVVWSITEDKEGYVWIGTYRGGLNKFDKKKKKIISFENNKISPNSIPDNHIRSLAVDNHNNLWVGCYEGGLSMYNDKTKNFIHLDKFGINEKTLGSKQITDIYIENDSIFWIAAYGGGLTKFVFNPKNKLMLKRYVHDPNNKSSLSDDRTYTIYEDKSGTLWIGTFGGGLNKFDKRTEKFTNFRNSPDDTYSISEDRILNIFEDSEGIIWIGTYGGGLNQFDRELNRFTRITEDEGLTSYVVYGILEDEHKNLWMSTNNGIFKYSRDENIFTQYDLSDGVQSLEFSGGAYYKTRDGEMYFGGINGINSFYPDSIKYISYIPNIVISSLKVLNNPVKGERKEIELSHTENFFSFEFASLDYSNPEDCRYAYMLDGFDEEWRSTDAKQRVAMYTNLPSGDYVFRVIGSNSDGIWNYEGAYIKLTVLPPFWKTWWFIMGIIILFLLGVYFISTLRIRSLLAIEKLKTKLAADLHDSVGSGLTEISILSELVSREVNNGSGNVSQNLKSISETSRYLIDNMSDIVWVVNPLRDSLHDLIIRLKDSYNDVLTYKGILLKTTNLDKLENIRLPMEYRQNLFLIFKEGINNSLKHSKCSQIILEANIRGDVLEMVLKDNGIGMRSDEKIMGNGLRNMEERARIIGGKLKWRSVSNSETTITFVGKIDSGNKLLYSVKRFLNVSN